MRQEASIKGSVKIGTFAGVPVRLHLTFLLLIAFVAVSHLLGGGGAAAAAAGVAFVLALFASVLLHEYGHALAARRYGIRTRDITLLPIGGVAMLERVPETPRQEAVVALAGPAVNVGIAAALFAWLRLTGGFEPVAGVTLTTGSLVERVMLANVTLVLFNLIPAFPMDGGRVLRAALASAMDHARATRIAARVGQGAAVLFAGVGLFTNPFLLLIAVFVWLGATQEAAAAEVKSALTGTPVRRAMVVDYATLAPWDTNGRAAELILQGSQREFPVVDRGEIVGLVTAAEIIRALGERGVEGRIAAVMQRDFDTVHPGEMLEAVLARLDRASGRPLPVVEGGRLLGLVTVENVGEFFAIRSALRA